jgi:triacylglycerol esterase/lipase EstA (alpha/beta hydrolase family)
MRPEEVRALGDIAGEAAAGLAVQIGDMHEGIAKRAFRGVGPAAAPVQLAHDRIARAAYGAARGLTRAIVRAGAAAVSAGMPEDAASLAEAPGGRIVVGALNGMFGDRLERRANALALQMTVRRGERDVGLTRAELGRAFPDAAAKVAVFVHGLCETDDAWKLGGARHVPYGFRLQVELGYTPLFIRYNTGRHISDNGREFARLLDELVAGWPRDIHEIALIGHSMGGLVSRSACHYGAGSGWATKVRHVFTLGAPHLGAPLEQLANRASVALARLPETRGLAKALNLRSSGIKDLRYGYLVEEDWLEIDCDAFLRKAACEIPFPATANHYFVCATLARERDAPVSRIIGDMLVLPASAWHHEGRGKRLRFPVDHYRHVGGANHFDLLNHPAIYEQIRRWLSSRRALPPGPV